MRRQMLLFGALLVAIVFFPSTAHAGNGALCDGVFHWVYVAGTENLDGSETGFQYICQTGSPTGQLAVYLESGGACWTGDNCDCQPNSIGQCTNPNSTITQSLFNQSTSDDGLPWSQTSWGGGSGRFGVGFESCGGRSMAAFAGSTSPFNQNWNIVFIPYVTGDGHMGNSMQKLTTSAGKSYTAHFRGYRNVTNDLAVIASLFPSPSKVAIWGASAGGAGADCNLRKFSSTWPNTNMSEMNNSLPALGANNLMPLFASVTQEWGVWELSPSGGVAENTCPVIAPPGSTNWNLEWVVRYNATNLPSVRKALTDDYSDPVMSQFACLLGATPDANGSCSSAVAGTLTGEFNDVISSATNYKVFYHTGACHCCREDDGNTTSTGFKPSCDYDKMQQSGVNFTDWVSAWINNSPAWVNVQ